MVALGGGHAWDTKRYGDTFNERVVRILLECILVQIKNAISELNCNCNDFFPIYGRGSVVSDFLTDNYDFINLPICHFYRPPTKFEVR